MLQMRGVGFDTLVAFQFLTVRMGTAWPCATACNFSSQADRETPCTLRPHAPRPGGAPSKAQRFRGCFVAATSAIENGIHLQQVVMEDTCTNDDKTTTTGRRSPHHERGWWATHNDETTNNKATQQNDGRRHRGARLEASKQQSKPHTPTSHPGPRLQFPPRQETSWNWPCYP